MANKAPQRAEPTVNEDGTVHVFLHRSVGLRGGALYGPGWADVPQELFDALQLSPEPVQTDHTGAPLVNTMAASALPPRGTFTGTAVPVPVRDEETGEEIEPDEDDVPAGESPGARRAREIAEAGETGEERTGNRLLAETGAHVDESRTLQPHPGQLEATPEQERRAAIDTEEAERRAANDRGDYAPARRSSGGRGSSEDATTAKPATKSALQEYGDRDELAELARAKGVKVNEDDNKRDLVDKLYDARVSLDDGAD